MAEGGSLTQPAVVCRACGDTSIKTLHVATEMHFGTGGSYRYQECARCGSLTLSNPPELAQHYPSVYYRHLEERAVPVLRLSVRALRAIHDRVVPCVSPLTGRWGLGLRGASRSSERVLDVGCGAGHMLRRLRALGMSDLTGVDPYGTDRSSADRAASGAPRLIRGRVEDVYGTFDVAVFNHSLEHVDEPSAVLSAVKSLLAPNGRVVIRTPMIGYAWRRYGCAWVQLDAPRHLVVFSHHGLCECARRAGLVVICTTYDSTSFQFWASEDFARHRAYAHGKGAAFLRLARSAASAWPLRAWLLNLRHDGDQVAVVLRAAA